MKKKEYTLELAGKTITAQFTDLAEQANGSAILTCDETVVMATATMSKSGRGNPGWFNLTVDYLEKFYAAGKILGSRFMRREGRPTDQAILASRVTDRTLRPLFEKHIKNAVQVIITVISVGNMDPVILGVNAASLALATSDIPWGGPIGAVQVGKFKNAEGVESDVMVNHYLPVVENPTEHYTLDLTVCGKGGNINMIEAMSYESSEADMSAAFETAVAEISKLEAWQQSIVNEIGKEKIVIEKPETPESIVAFFETHCKDPLTKMLGDGCSKEDIYANEDEWKEKIEEQFGAEESDQLIGLAHSYYHHKVDEIIHELALNEDKRADGRALNQVRGLYAQAGGISPVLHGSGIFYRGETHVLSVLTLGSPDDSKIEDGIGAAGKKYFMHHYNFPPYSAGETGRVGGLNRRETGHGALVEKALTPVLPSREDFPYTVRVVSESTASNGSTSQASICASTLALMDGGVPITSPVAGIAMGLMMDENDHGKYKILSDIQGPEDHHGDMDFKVAGTKNGITAIQLDIKVGGIPVTILQEALTQAKVARETILETITGEIAEPRPEISERAPKILSTKILEEQIGLVIGKGGETIQGIQEDTGAMISIEDDGTVFVTGVGDSADKALARIAEITRIWEVGEVTEGEVIKILEVGAIVKFGGSQDGMVHISEIANFRVAKVDDHLKPGMKVPVKIMSIDKMRGRIGLSIKAADPEFVKQPSK